MRKVKALFRRNPRKSDTAPPSTSAASDTLSQSKDKKGKGKARDNDSQIWKSTTTSVRQGAPIASPSNLLSSKSLPADLPPTYSEVESPEPSPGLLAPPERRPPHPLPTSSTRVARGWTIFTQAVRLLDKTTDSIGVPGVKAVVGAFVFIVDQFDHVDQNDESFRDIGHSVGQLQGLLAKYEGHEKLPESVSPHVQKLTEDLSNIDHSLRELQRRGTLLKLVDSSVDGQKVTRLFQHMKFKIDYFLVEVNLAIENHVEVIRKMIVLSKLHRAEDAAFDPSVSGCLEGTRIAVLEDIHDWIFSSDGGSVFWLNGVAGSGKSSIARSIAASMKDREYLGASFFCSRGSAKRRDVKLIIPTLMFQLCCCYSRFYLAVRETLETDLDIAYRSPNEQLQKLIVNPLTRIGSFGHPIVVIIDALDECDDRRAAYELLKLLGAHLTTLGYVLKIIITSRPEHEMKAGFQDEVLPHENLVLHDISKDTVNEDIRTYVLYQLKTPSIEYVDDSKIRDDNWPQPDHLDQLVAQCDGLFMYAFTACQWILGSMDVTEGLDEILSLRYSGIHRDGLHSLYTLYEKIFGDALKFLKRDTDRSNLRLIFATVLFVSSPMSLQTLAQLLRLKPHYVTNLLRDLHSVILVSREDQVIQPYHASLFDYLTKPSDHQAFFIEAGHYHLFLARQCLEFMNEGLRRNICDLNPSSARFCRDKQFQRTVNARIPLVLQYACANWGYHLSSADRDASSKDIEALLGVLDAFARRRILEWIECMSLSDLTAETLTCVSGALLWTAAVKASVHSLFLDTKYFIQEFFIPISTMPLEVYHTALSWTPSNTAIKRLYEQSAAGYGITLSNALEIDWENCRQTIECPDHLIASISLSSDGEIVAAGATDGYVLMYNVNTGILISAIPAHQQAVPSVRLSPDDSILASSSWDGTIRLWATQTSALSGVLEGHTGPVYNIAFSPKGKYIASASQDSSVIIWHARKKTLLMKLDGHKNDVYAVRWFPLGSLEGHLLSGGDDRTLRIWNTKTGAQTETFRGHTGTIYAVAISSDGKTLASSSVDQTIKVWNALSGTCVHTLQGHTSAIVSVNFSPDDSSIVSSSWDNTISIWDVSAGTLTSNLKGHKSFVTSAAFSPGGETVVSGSWDNSIRVWDAKKPALQSVLQKHEGPIGAVVFSDDGALVASGGEDKTVMVWDAKEGRLIHTLEGHADIVTFMKFSPDGSILASASMDGILRTWETVKGTPIHMFDDTGQNYVLAFSSTDLLAAGSSDCTVRLFDIHNGILLHAFEGHAFPIQSLAFSPTRDILASGSVDRSIRLWDVQSGALKHILRGHTDVVVALAFAPTGRALASGSWDGYAAIWDVDSGSVLGVLRTAEDSTRIGGGGGSPKKMGLVRKVTFSPSGELLAAQDWDERIQIWDAMTGMPQVIYVADSALALATNIDDAAHVFWDRLIVKPLAIEETLSLMGDDAELVPPAEGNVVGQLHRFYMQNNWLFHARDGKQLWIPQKFRGQLHRFRDERLVISTESGSIIFLNFSRRDSS